MRALRTSKYIAINGHELPPPKRDIEVIETTAVNAGRNANGVVVGQKIGRNQYKLNGLEWPWLSAEEWSTILTLLEPFYVDVTFVNPRTNSFETIKMYPGDRSAKPYYLDSDTEKPTYYKECKVNLIDTGL